MPEVAVIDYGLGNLLSVRRGLEHCGATVTVTSDPNTILSAPRVVLPGVGAFAHGMAELRNQGLDVIVRKVAAQGSTVNLNRVSLAESEHAVKGPRCWRLSVKDRLK